MKNGDKWVALAALVASYACATGVTLDGEDVNILQLEQDGGAGVGPVLGGSGGVGPGSGGSGPGAGRGGTGGTGGTSAGGTGSSTGGGGGAPPAQGGAGGAGGALAQGGSPGAGGTGGPPPGPTGECVATTTLQVFYTENQVDATSIRMTLAVGETPAATYPVRDLTVRYWFDDDNQVGYVGDVDFSTQGNQTPPLGTAVTIGEAQGVNFAEVRFTSTNPMGIGIQTIQIRVHTAQYTPVVLTNDFSFLDGATNLVHNKISAYVAGEQVFGCEPPDP